MTNEARRPGGAEWSDAAAWEASEDLTRVGREQLQYLLTQQPVAADIGQRFANVDPASRDGHVFEWMHELSFNLDAIANDDTARAHVTEWLATKPDPHAPADLRLYDGHGNVIAEAQAKAVSSVSERISVHGGISDAKYDGMQLLVPSDHVGPAAALLDRRLALPTGLFHEQYDDARDRLTDHLHAQGSVSDPVSVHELHVTGHDPARHLDHHIESVELGQIGDAAAGAAFVAALTKASIEAATAIARNRSFDGLPWIELGRVAAAGGIRSAVVGTLGNTGSVAAQHSAHIASSNVIAELANGAGAYAIGRAAWDIAGVTHGFATGRLTSEEAAVHTAAAITRSAAVWGCGAVGQLVIPVPYVGAMVGGLVGQIGAAAVVSGVQWAIGARSTLRQWDANYELLLRRVVELEQAAQREIKQLAQLATQTDLAFNDLVLPRLAFVTAQLGTVSTVDVLTDLAALTIEFAGTPVFATMAKFDAFMSNSDAVLRLDFGGKPIIP